MLGLSLRSAQSCNSAFKLFSSTKNPPPLLTPPAPLFTSPQAAQNVLVEHWAADPQASSSLRPLNVHDMLAAAAAVRPGVTRAQEYGMAHLRSSSSSHFDQPPPFGSSGDTGGSRAAAMAQLMAAAAAAQSSGRAGGKQQQKQKSSAAADGSNGGGAAGDESSQDESSQDEVYKMVGKMVLNSLAWQQ